MLCLGWRYVAATGMPPWIVFPRQRIGVGLLLISASVRRWILGRRDLDFAVHLTYPLPNTT